MLLPEIKRLQAAAEEYERALAAHEKAKARFQFAAGIVWISLGLGLAFFLVVIS